VVGRLRGVVTGRRGGGRGVEVASCVAGIRVAVPPTLPGALGVRLSILNLEVVIRVPTDSQDRLADDRWIVR